MKKNEVVIKVKITFNQSSKHIKRFNNSEVIHQNKQCCNAALICTVLDDHMPTQNVDRCTLESATRFGFLLLGEKPAGVL